MNGVRRILLIAVGAVALVLVQAGVAAADDQLDELLDRAGQAEYAGNQVVLADWDGETAIEFFEVSSRGSVMLVRQQSGQAVVANGKVISSAASGDVVVPEWSTSVSQDRYTVVDTRSIEFLGRAATAVEVFEGGQRRARLVFDAASGAAVASELFDGDGEPYRVSYLLSFEAIVDEPMTTNSADVDVLLPVDDVDLPVTAGGYARVDAYGFEGEQIQAFYSDGLFSFSVFAIAGRIDAGPLGEATEFEVDRSVYRRMVTAGDVWVYWTAAGTSYVLVGDLPPDHLQDVLSDLPHRQRRGLLSRIWHGLFG